MALEWKRQFWILVLRAGWALLFPLNVASASFRSLKLRLPFLLQGTADWKDFSSIKEEESGKPNQQRLNLVYLLSVCSGSCHFFFSVWQHSAPQSVADLEKQEELHSPSTFQEMLLGKYILPLSQASTGILAFKVRRPFITLHLSLFPIIFNCLLFPRRMGLS